MKKRRKSIYSGLPATAFAAVAIAFWGVKLYDEYRRMHREPTIRDLPQRIVTEPQPVAPVLVEEPSSAVASNAPMLGVLIESGTGAVAAVAKPVAPIEFPPLRPRRSPGLTFTTNRIAADFSAGQMMRPKVWARIAGAAGNALLDRTWGDYLAYAGAGILSTLKQSAALPRERRFDPVLNNPLLATLLDQSAVIRRAGAETLNALSGEEDSRDFLAWFMQSRPAMEDFLLSIAPSTDAGGALKRWAELWKNEDAKFRDKYASLALACALVFGQPVNMVDTESYGYDPVNMGSRYTYFRSAAEKHALKTVLADMPAWQLCWVVDAGVPNQELDWARMHVNYLQREMGKAYDDVRYRMDKLSKGNAIYKKYTLAEIRKEGGICGDRAHYASTVTKAHGIPAMVIGGDGDIGGHAWMGYMSSSRDWNLAAGRIDANYANGSTTDPQTRNPMGEKEIAIFADPQRRSDKWRRSYRHAWLADLLAADSQPALVAKAYEIALQLSPRNIDVFKAYAAFLQAADTPADVMADAIREMRVAFRNYPDQIKVANELEADLAYKTKGAKESAEALHRQTRRMESKFADRTDLLLENLDREVEMLIESGADADLEKLYRRALWDHSDSVVLFRDLVNRYADFARKRKDFKDAVWYIGYRFRQAHPRPHPSSYFEAMTYAGMMDMMAGLYDETGAQDRAERMRKDAERMREIAAEQTKRE